MVKLELNTIMNNTPFSEIKIGDIVECTLHGKPQAVLVHNIDLNKQIIEFDDWHKNYIRVEFNELDKIQKVEPLKIEFERQELEFDKNVRFILGRPSFVLGPIARRLRELGIHSAHRAEDEQATVIFWMLKMYIKYGDDYKEEINRFLAP